MTNPIKILYWKIAKAFQHTRMRRGTPQQIFSAIYQNKSWGTHDEFSSGSGSHTSTIVEPYVDAVKDFLQRFNTAPVVVDIGCGDFAVGSRLVENSSFYIACDVVPDLIAWNKKRFSDVKLRFEVLDAIADPLPPGDVVCIRQVLQHLSNDQIHTIVKKLSCYQHWVITEHLPACLDFFPNADKRAGHDIRLISENSGIVLTMPPFNVRPKQETIICEVPESIGNISGVIRTVVYSF